MTSTSELDSLLALADRLKAERRRIVQLLLASPAEGALDEALLRQLAVIHGASLGLAAEIEAHTPTVGHGGEA
jgi:hypothetical protein